MKLGMSSMDGLDWEGMADSLLDLGFARAPGVLSVDTCRELVALYDDDEVFRKRIDLERYGYGRGSYGYFASPIPTLVAALRTQLYRRLAPIANDWSEKLGDEERFPSELEDFLARCHRAGQEQPTPLLLRYEEGGFNCLHQDLYGDLVFPLQIAFCLSRRGEEFEGGEFLLVEQRPRAQSRGHALGLDQGEMVVFPSSRKPRLGARGYSRTAMRHGVSTISRGSRFTLGLIFHDARS